MTFLLTKLCISIFEIIVDLFTMLFSIFLEKPALFEAAKFEKIMVTIQIICAVLCVLSVMKDIIFRLSGIEGNIYDLNIGEYITKIIFNIIGISLFPKILTVMINLSIDIYGYINYTSKEMFHISIESYKNIDIAATSLIMIIILIVILYFGIKALITLAKTQIEILIANIIFPIVLIDFYKGSDKLNSFLSKTVGLFVNMCIQIFIIYLGVSFMVQIPGSISSDFIWNIFVAIACFQISANPSIASELVTAPTSGSGIGNSLQKAYYGSKIFSATKRFFTKGVV